jgi:hypothetical protein
MRSSSDTHTRQYQTSPYTIVLDLLNPPASSSPFFFPQDSSVTMMSTAHSTTKEIVSPRSSENSSAAGPNRHIRSTSVYAPLIPTYRDAAINQASRGVLLWNKSDPIEKPILETLGKLGIFFCIVHFFLKDFANGGNG